MSACRLANSWILSRPTTFIELRRSSLFPIPYVRVCSHPGNNVIGNTGEVKCFLGSIQGNVKNARFSKRFRPFLPGHRGQEQRVWRAPVGRILPCPFLNRGSNYSWFAREGLPSELYSGRRSLSVGIPFLEIFEFLVKVGVRSLYYLTNLWGELFMRVVLVQFDLGFSKGFLGWIKLTLQMVILTKQRFQVEKQGLK